MCGVGLIHSPDKSNEQRELIAKKMHESIQHRGPDGFGVWSDTNGLSLFHRRLAIVDLSPTGRQPMVSASDRWIISFNGEIYNHGVLRHLLAGKNLNWKGTSDTEVLLHLIDLYGPVEAIKQCEGMFAIVLWDRENKDLYLMRDRIGEKPLYYGKIGDDFVVGSELKVFHSHPGFSGEINPQALAAFFKYNYVPSPHSIFKNIHKVKPGHVYKFHLDKPGHPEIETYWSLRSYKEQLPAVPSISFDETKLSIKELLLRAVGQQMQADVPLGVFLSGGVDSTLICALMASLSAKPPESFTIGFADENYDESPFAKKIASHLGTRHTELIVSAKDCLAAIEKMPEVYDEPFADSSQIPTFLLAKMTRQQVTVALSGDGGDELFAGYNRYSWAGAVWDKSRWIPPFLRTPIAEFGLRVDSERLSRGYSRFAKLLGRAKKVENAGTKLAKGLGLVKAKSLGELHDRLLSQWFETERLLPGKKAFSLHEDAGFERRNFETYMMWHDQNHYLPDDIMVKVDRAAMAHSLETRAPFLDHRLIDFVISCPREFVRNVQSPKKIIKDLLSEYVPRHLSERPKMGFGIPIYEWFKTDLKEITLDLLAEPLLKEQGIFDAKFVSQFAHSQLNRNLTHPYHLWSLLMFQLWHRKWTS